jgi:hypothetical protein
MHQVRRKVTIQCGIKQVVDHFLKYHMKILLRDFNVKLGKEGIFKPTIANESLHLEISINGVS